jgi:hypothetical protein
VPSLRDRLQPLELLAPSGSRWAAPLAFLAIWSLVGLVIFRRRQFPSDPKITGRKLVVSLTVIAVALTFLRFQDKGGQLLNAAWNTMGGLIPDHPVMGILVFIGLCAVPALYLVNRCKDMDVPTPSNVKMVRARM